MKSKLQFSVAKKAFLALILLGIILTGGFLLFSTSPTETGPAPTDLQFAEAGSAVPSVQLTDFNPNDLDAEQWMSLGFSEKQAATILKYRDVVGGAFTSKQQFKKCYAVSEEKFRELGPYLMLPETNSASTKQRFSSAVFRPATFAKKDLRIPGRFNPDAYGQQDWETLGFSAKQAAAILKYRTYLGGSFISKEKFRECFIISSENYEKLEPYLILPEHTPAGQETRPGAHQIPAKTITKSPLQNFDPNLLDLNGWKSLGFSEKQAQVILNYRERILKGNFRTLEEIKNCFVISDKKFEELSPYIQLNPENFGRKAATPSGKTQTTQLKTDFSKVDLNEITFDQLTEFGFDERAARNFLGFRKKLGGFAHANQIFESYDIDRAMAEKLASTAMLNTSKVEKYTLTDAPESWLKTHPYFRYSADKIIYYRLSNPDEKKIWKLIKVKPEYEQKMRLYLK